MPIAASATSEMSSNNARKDIVCSRRRKHRRGLSLCNNLGECLLEHFVLAALKDTCDRRPLGQLVLGQVSLRVAERVLLLLRRRLEADPDEDGVVGVEDERVVAVEQLLVDGGALGDLGHLELAAGVRDLEERERAAVDADVGRGGRDRCRLAADDGPREARVGALLVRVHLRLAGALVVESARERRRLVLLEDAGALALPDVDVQAEVENERVALVEAGAGERHLDGGDGLLGALDVEQARLVLLGLDVGEAGLDAALEQLDAVGKERGERGRLVALDLAVLDRRTAELVVELDSLVGGGAGLVLRGVRAEPEVDVPVERGLAGQLVGVEDDVRVARVELAVLRLGPRLDLELLNAPDLNADLFAGVVPRGFLLCRGGLDFLFKVRAEICNVRLK
jgi:hypothetical protein